MSTTDKKENRENKQLLHGLSLLLNISVLAMTAFIGWSIYSAIENSSAIYNVLNSTFLP